MRLIALHALPALLWLEIAGNAVLAGWALLSDLRRRSALSTAFWTVLLIVVLLVAVQAGAGILLAVGGARPRAPLHFLYGLLVGIGAVLQFGLRPGGGLRRAVWGAGAGPGRESRALTLLCLTQAALLVRAYTTGAFGR
ncbi:MAG TPA: hypothetical protein VNN19_13365 [bacterium]|nr:hypothetical protein [bacterium]